VNKSYTLTRPGVAYYDPTMGALDLSNINRETVIRWTVAGVVTMGALLAARAVLKRKRKRR
jgi:hypothetical protein